jgi:adenylate cyclase
MATDVGLLVFAALLLLLTLPWLSASHAFLLCAFVLAVPLVLHAYLFHALGMVLPFAAFLFLVVANYVLNLSYRHISESKAKRDLASLLGSYVPGQLVDKLLQDANSHTMKATNKDMTVMFCDLRGFTQLGQDIPPIKLQHLLNDVFSRLSRIILLHQGTVDKYMGDCIMAFWGAPDELPSHAEQAVSAALAIIREVKKINLEHQAKFLPIVRLGIGINTGVMCVGDMGSSIRRSYTVVGDAVNTAARLESLTKTHQLDLLVGLSTKLAAPMFYWVLIDTVLLAGKANKLAIFTVNQHAKVLK